MKYVIVLFMTFGLLSACTIIDSEGDVDFHQSHTAERELHLPEFHSTTNADASALTLRPSSNQSFENSTNQGITVQTNLKGIRMASYKKAPAKTGRLKVPPKTSKKSVAKASENEGMVENYFDLSAVKPQRRDYGKKK